MTKIFFRIIIILLISFVIFSCGPIIEKALQIYPEDIVLNMETETLHLKYDLNGTMVITSVDIEDLDKNTIDLIKQEIKKSNSDFSIRIYSDGWGTAVITYYCRSIELGKSSDGISRKEILSMYKNQKSTNEPPPVQQNNADGSNRGKL